MHSVIMFLLKTILVFAVITQFHGGTHVALAGRIGDLELEMMAMVDLMDDYPKPIDQIHRAYDNLQKHVNQAIKDRYITPRKRSETEWQGDELKGKYVMMYDVNRRDEEDDDDTELSLPMYSTLPESPDRHQRHRFHYKQELATTDQFETFIKEHKPYGKKDWYREKKIAKKRRLDSYTEDRQRNTYQRREHHYTSRQDEGLATDEQLDNYVRNHHPGNVREPARSQTRYEDDSPEQPGCCGLWGG